MQPQNKKRIAIALVFSLILGGLYTKWTFATDRFEGEFVAMVYYAGAVDIVLSRQNVERQFRIKSENPIFGHVISMLSDPVAIEGPPESNKELIGQSLCVELNRHSDISDVWLSDSSEIACQ